MESYIAATARAISSSSRSVHVMACRHEQKSQLQTDLRGDRVAKWGHVAAAGDIKSKLTCACERYAMQMPRSRQLLELRTASQYNHKTMIGLSSRPTVRTRVLGWIHASNSVCEQWRLTHGIRPACPCSLIRLYHADRLFVYTRTLAVFCICGVLFSTCNFTR